MIVKRFGSLKNFTTLYLLTVVNYVIEIYNFLLPDDLCSHVLAKSNLRLLQLLGFYVYCVELYMYAYKIYEHEGLC